MTSISSLEPQASGSIVLKTTFGDLEVELFTQQCPKATRNFVQLCLDDYYTGTIFNRVEKDFIAIGGVVEGKSSPPECSFKDEFHPRLRFSRRGLLATANTEKDANGAEFFFTLGPAPELQNKHTIFGRLKGDTVYHLVDLNDCQVDDDLVPLSEKKILETIVFDNPYPDLKPRQKFFHNRIAQEPSEEEDHYDPLNKPKLDVSKSKKLSFYQDSDDDDEDEDQPQASNVASGNTNSTSVTIDLKPNKPQIQPASPVDEHKSDTDTEESEAIAEEAREDSREKRLRDIRAQIQALKDQFGNSSELSKSSGAGSGKEHQDATISPGDHNASADHATEVRRATKKGHQRERETLELLENFKKKLKDDAKRNIDITRSINDRGGDKQVKVVKHQMDKPDSLLYEDNELLDDLDKIDGDAWLQHKFEPPNDDVKLARDANTKDDSWYSIDDPRNSMTRRALNNHALEYRRSQNSSHPRHMDDRSSSSYRHSRYHDHRSSRRHA